MNDDMYLSLAADLFKNGTWDKDTFKKRVMLHAEEKNIDINAVNEFFNRVIGKEYTLDEKKNFLAVITLNGEELKYGNAVHTMRDDMVERFFEMEVSSLDKETVDRYHALANVNSSIETQEVQEDVSVNNTVNNQRQPIKCRIVKEDKVVGLPVREVKKEKEMTVSEQLETFQKPEVNAIGMQETEKNNSIYNNDNNVIDSSVEIPALSFDEVVEKDMPTTEEEFKQQEEVFTKKEKDSVVKKIEISPERLEKLKRTKNRAINYSLKAVAVIVALQLLGPLVGGGLIVGYSYLAEEIKIGAFNPTNPVGKAVKHAVEKVMYMGMNKDMEKGGRSR